MTTLLLLAVAAPVVAGVIIALAGWRPATATLATLASGSVVAAAVGLWTQLHGRVHLAAGDVLRVDALSVAMLIVIGSIGTLCLIASIGYLEREIATGHTDEAGARRYGVLVCVFLAAMALAVQANNLGVLWVAIEATTIATAFLVGHRRSRAALEATWKYVIICSTGIAFAFLGTVLLYDAGRHAVGSGSALDLNTLTSHAALLDPHVTRLAAGLLLLGYGAKAGLAPLHTWLADAHSQAPAPVSALMSGVLLAVAFTAVLRIKSVADAALGTGFMRTGLLISGLLTMAVAAALLVAQRDLKRMLAYSSMENMGLIAVAAAAGTTLAVTALLLQVLAHGAAKTVLFLSAAQLQTDHDSTAIADMGGLMRRRPRLGSAVALGLIALAGLPPFALFASEISIGRALARAHLGWALAACAVLLLVAYAALLTNGIRLLLGSPSGSSTRRAPATASARRATPTTLRVAISAGLAISLALGVSAGPFRDLLHEAASRVAAR